MYAATATTAVTDHDRRSSPREALYRARRKYPRLRAPVEVFYESGARVAVAGAVDLSLRGVFVPTRHGDPAGTLAVVRLELPGHTRMVRIHAEVVRSTADGMGLNFRAMRDDDRALLAAYLIRTLGLRALPQLDRRFPWLVHAEAC